MRIDFIPGDGLILPPEPAAPATQPEPGLNESSGAIRMSWCGTDAQGWRELVIATARADGYVIRDAFESKLKRRGEAAEAITS